MASQQKISLINLTAGSRKLVKRGFSIRRLMTHWHLALPIAPSSPAVINMFSSTVYLYTVISILIYKFLTAIDYKKSWKSSSDLCDGRKRIPESYILIQSYSQSIPVGRQPSSIIYLPTSAHVGTVNIRTLNIRHRHIDHFQAVEHR